MSAESRPFVYCGIRCLTVNALVDTGSDRSVLTTSLAAELGLQLGQAEVVDTNGGPVVWNRSRARVALPNQPAVDVDVWIAPDGVRVSLGANALRDLGFQLVAPEPINYDVLSARGIPVPETEGYFDGSRGPEPMSAAASEGDYRASSRLAVCAGCSLAKHLPVVGIQCTMCGCLMGVKARLPGASCPAGKW